MVLQSFDETYYLQNNPDVLQAILSGAFASAEQHYIQFGEKEGRQPSSFFNPAYYFSNNPDVLAAVQSGAFSTGLQHYETFGVDEGRQGLDGFIFDEAFYLASNPDVAQAVADGAFNSGYSHFVQYGAEEGRPPAEGEDGGVPGQTFVLTTGVDAIVGTQFNDTVIGFVNYNTADGTTLNSSDTIDGGAGFDVLKVTIEYTSENDLNLNMQNVEKMEIRDFDGQTFYTTSVTGLTTVSLVAGDNEDTYLDSGTYIVPNIEFHNGEYYFEQDALTVQKIPMLNVLVDNADAEVYQYSDNPDGGRSNYQHATITSTGAGINNGQNYLYLGESQGADGVTVTGTTNLELEIEHWTNNAGLAGSVNTVDASTLDAGLEIDLYFNGATGETKAVLGGMGDDNLDDYSSNKAFNISYATGDGNDDVNLTSGGASNNYHIDLGAGNDLLVAGAYGAGDSADGGDGDNDVINLNSGALLTATTAPTITNFEALDVSGGGGTYDLSLNGFDMVQVDQAISGGLTAALVLDKAASGLTFAMYGATPNGGFSLGQAQTINLADATGTSDTVNFVSVIRDGSNGGAAAWNTFSVSTTVAGVENISVDSTLGAPDGQPGVSGYRTSFQDLVADSVKTLTLTGDAGIEFAALTNAGNTLTKVDASGSTGFINLNLSALTSSVAYTGASGVDTYTATNGGSIYGRGGNDAITLVAAGTKADVVIYKSASDVSLKDANGDGKIDAGTIETITNFLTASSAGGLESDVVDVTSFNFAGYAGSIVNKGALADGVVSGNFSASIADFFADAAGDRGVAIGTFGADTYVFVDANQDGNWNIANDLAVKVAGVNDFTVNDVAF